MQAQGESACSASPSQVRMQLRAKKAVAAATHKKPLSDVCVCTLTLSFQNIFLNVMSELRLDLCVHVCVCVRERVSVCVRMKPFARWEFVKWEKISENAFEWSFTRNFTTIPGFGRCCRPLYLVVWASKFKWSYGKFFL